MRQKIRIFAAVAGCMALLATGAQAAYSDIPESHWAYDVVNQSADLGVIQGRGDGTFGLGQQVTRAEFAAMLDRLMGWELTAPAQASYADVPASAWYYDAVETAKAHGAVTDTGVFRPDADITREEMAVSLGWSRLELQDGQAYLNTTNAGGNSWCVPDGYEDAVNYYKGTGTQMNLAVQMTDQAAANAILPDAAQRARAIEQLVQAADDLGVDGVTVDFEGLKGDGLKNGLTAFVQELKAALGGSRPVYVCVHPVLKNGGAYYDAYDYRALGEAVDKVILMAHDYAASSMDQATADSGFTTTPVSPFEEVYYALHMATDDQTGVRDTSKLVLGLSVSNTAGWTLQDGKVINLTANHPAMDTILRRMGQSDTRITYSDTYRNPYMTYTDDDGNTNILWYEDAQSLTDKIELARMFGVSQVSVWRLGAIPADARWDLWSALTE